jgi:hypothetical protein
MGEEERYEKLFVISLGIRMDEAIAILLIIDMAEDEARCHTVDESPRSDLLIHRGHCGLKRCGYLSGVIRGMFMQIEDNKKSREEDGPDASLVAYSTGSDLIN